MTERLPSGPEPAASVLWADVLRFVRRHWAWMVVPAVLAGLVAAGWSLRTPPTYEAAALLTVGGERPVGEFDVPLLPGEGYLRMLRSRPVLSETRRRLAQAEGGRDGEPAELDLEPRLMVSRRGELGNTSLLELVARAASPQEASATANAWAEAFLSQDLLQVQLAALEAGYHELSGQQMKAKDRYDRTRDRLQGLRSQLASTPETLTLRSRLGDQEILANKAQGGVEGSLIVSQQLNPVHGEIAAQAAAAEAEVGALAAQLAELASSRETLAREIAAHRQPGLEPSPLALEPVPGLLLPAYGSAQLVAAAQPPVAPLPRRAAARILLAAIGGAILGFLIAAVRAVLAQPSTSFGPDVRATA